MFVFLTALLFLGAVRGQRLRALKEAEAFNQPPPSRGRGPPAVTLTFITNFSPTIPVPYQKPPMAGWGQASTLWNPAPCKPGRWRLGWPAGAGPALSAAAYQGRELLPGAATWPWVAMWCSWAAPRTAGFCPGCVKPADLPVRGRWYKTGPHPGPGLEAWLHHGRFRRAPLYLLCASAYGASDAARAGCYQAGPTARLFSPGPLSLQRALLSQKDPTGRSCGQAASFSWKHPLTAIALAGRLQEAALPFRLTLLGTGPERQAMEQEITGSTWRTRFKSWAAAAGGRYARRWSRPISSSSPRTFRRAGEPY